MKRIERVRLLMDSAHRVLADLWNPSSKASVDDLLVVGDSIRGLLAAEVERRLSLLLAAEMSVVCVQAGIGELATILVSTPLHPHSWLDLGQMANPNRRHHRGSQTILDVMFGVPDSEDGLIPVIAEAHKLLGSCATLGMLPTAPTRSSALQMNPMSFMSARGVKSHIDHALSCDRSLLQPDRSMTH